MAAMSAESRAEYLKKYLDQPKEKKKRKRKDVPTKNLRIIEEDSFLPIPDASPERSKKARKSQIHSSSDSEDEESKLLAAAKKLKEAEANKFRADTFVSIDNEEPNRSSDRSVPSSSVAAHKEFSATAKHGGEKSLRRATRNEDLDASPPRRRKHEDLDESPPRSRGRNDVDASPPRRRKQDVHPLRQCKEEVVSDSSPPRRGRNDLDASPPRRRRHDSSDASPPRRHSQHGSSTRTQKDSDASPARRRERNEQDASFPRRRKHDDSDESPPRQRGRGNTDTSPPRRRRQDASPRRFKQETPDVSLPRRRSTSPSSHRRNRSSPEKITSRVKQENTHEEEETPFATPRKRQTLFQRKKRGKEPEDPLKKARESAKQKEWEAKYSEWSKGLHQTKQREAKLQEMSEVAQEKFTRYADDEAMNTYLKEQIYDDLDPMAKYYRAKQEKIEMKTGTVYPKYKGHWAPNRFGIPPGYRWDGVDRSNGFEAKIAGAENERKAQEAIAYRSIVECEE